MLPKAEVYLYFPWELKKNSLWDIFLLKTADLCSIITS